MKAKTHSIQSAEIKVISNGTGSSKKWSYLVTLDGETLACSSEKCNLSSEAAAISQAKLVIKSQLYYDPKVTIITVVTGIPAAV